MPHPSSQPSPAPSSRVERRTFRRATVGLPALVETESGSLSGRVVNVSPGGVAIEGDCDLRSGDTVSVYFELSAIGYAVEARALVLRRDGRLLALGFVDLDRETALALRSFCRLSGLHRLNLR